MRHNHKSIDLTDRSSIGEVRRSAVALAQSIGFDEQQRSNIGIVATELATNAFIHANGGEFLLCPAEDEGATRLDLLVLDTGPGIADLGRAMEDGFSTIGTAGQGLGAIQRLSNAAAFFSKSNQGSAFWSRFEMGCVKLPDVINLPIAGELTPGDSYFTRTEGSRTVYMLVDGLGHGPGAAEAADEAVGAVRTHFRSSAADIVSRTHEALLKTRGAAMAVAIVDQNSKTLNYAGIGNISASLINTTSSRSLVSQNGTAGAVIPRSVQEHSYSFDKGTMLVMFSDGLTSKTSPLGFSGFQTRPGMLLAGLMYRDFSRHRDDASILVARLGDSY